jgi:hypothetical protein
MADFYQVPLDLSRTSPEYIRWEKANFIFRQIFDMIKNIDGRAGPIGFRDELSMGGNPISDGRRQTTAQDTDFITKSYLKSKEFGLIAVSLLSSSGKTPLPLTGSTGTPSGGEGGGGSGTSDHALLTNLDYASAGHTGFVPSTRSISTTPPLVGGGDLSSNRTISIPQVTGSVDGYLSATDWTTFNSKQAALTLGNLTESTSSVLTITGGTGAIIGSGTTVQVKLAGSAQNGYLSSGDWTTFNAKVGGSGTTGNIAKFAAAGTIEDSIIKEASGKIGIGTSGSPGYKLEVAGQIKLTDGSLLPSVQTLSFVNPVVGDASLGNHFRVTLTASGYVLGPFSN